ncbi:MAG: hypothetical protein EG824_01240 [Deltaproteobacteria bacterium]|nr:hypothetical protein [Deltaproteobacteria bacterium]
MVKAVFAERDAETWPDVSSTEIARHASSLLPGYEAWIGRLATPVVSQTATVLDVFQTKFYGKFIRVYPPFLIDTKGETTGAFAHSWIPEGSSKIERYAAVSPTAVLGATARPTIGEGTFFCEGLRIDFEAGADFDRFVSLLLENIGQHTHQWWLRGRTQPFRGMGRIGCALNSDFTLRDLLKFRGAGELESPWHGITQTQQLLGFEMPLSNNLWLRCCHDAALGMRGDSGILAFHDAISYYMGGDDVLCIMSLSVTVEILGNKRRILKDKKPTAFAELLKTSDLVDSKNKAQLDRLFVDRGHVAHGRKPHYVGGKTNQRIEEYIEAVQLLVSRYIQFIEPHEWPVASQLGIERKGST